MRAVDDVSFAVDAGERVAIVGESGSGKTVTALAIMGLLDPPGRIANGAVRLGGHALVGLPEEEYRRFRGRTIAMVFQDPTTALEPGAAHRRPDRGGGAGARPLGDTRDRGVRAHTSCSTE